MKNNAIPVKETPVQSQISNNSSNILSSYLPKDVLEEIDINNSSKTNSLSKNSSSDKSMDKTTKSQTNHNNINGNSDSNGNSNSNSNDNPNRKNGNSNSGSGSNEENNLSSRSLPNKSFLAEKNTEQSELAKNLTAKNHSYHQNWNHLMEIERLDLNRIEKFEEINDNENMYDIFNNYLYFSIFIKSNNIINFIQTFIIC